MRMLKADPTELRIIEALVRATDTQLYNLQKRQAGLIANAVSQIFKR